jgi:hypothetical protein
MFSSDSVQQELFGCKQVSVCQKGFSIFVVG